MQRSIGISNSNIVISLEIAYSEGSVFIDIINFFTKALNYVFFGNVERLFSFWDEIHGEILIVFVSWQSVLKGLLFVEGVNEGEGLRDFLDADWDEFSRERVDVPGVVVADSEFKGTEKEGDGVDSKDVLWPGETGNVVELEFLIFL